MRRHFSVLFCALAWFFSVARGETVTVSLLATTDLHGNIYPIDYYSGQSAPRGLAKIATLVREQRAQNPNNLLIDCGDTIQGSPLESVYQYYVRSGRLPARLRFSGPPLAHDPMILAMNQMGYQAMVLGNHEFNFGLENLRKARQEARFPWLSANTLGGENPFAAYLLRSVAGVKVAVIGVTTPTVPAWEDSGHVGAYRFASMKQAVADTAAALQREQHPDLIVVAAHAGLDREARGDGVAGIAEVPGVEAIVLGHSHQQVAEQHLGKVLLVQPKNWGMSLARLDFVMERAPGGAWSVVSKTSRLVPVVAETPADEAILGPARPYHELTERYLNTEVADSAASLAGTFGRVRDTALVDAIHQVQLYYAKADVSFAALFQPRISVPRGRVTVRQIALLYLYDNELFCLEGTGRMVRDALENAARYFLSCQDESCSQGAGINPRMAGFNYDMAEGVDYEIDLTRPPGGRIRNLRWKGRPLALEQKLRVAVSNYRAGGSGGYSMFAGAPIVWRSGEDIRDLMIRYYTERGRLPEKPDDNWRIVPPQAQRSLEKQVQGEGTAPI